MTHNVFSSSGYEHILLNETSTFASIRHNQIANNTFVSTKGKPIYRLRSVVDGTAVEQFGYYNDNVYTASPNGFAEVAGIGIMTYATWKARMKQDDRSALKSASHIQSEKAAKAGLEINS